MSKAGSLALLILSVLAPVPSAAQVVNGSFEDTPDHLNGWTLGPGARVEALQAANFGPDQVPVPDGSWYALISNGPGDVPAAPVGDFDANGTTDFDRSTLSTTFTTVLVDETLSLQWAFLTDEVGPGGRGMSLYDDLFEIRIDGVTVLNGSVNKPGGSSPFPDTVPYDGLRYTVSSVGLTDGSDFGSAAGGGATPFQSVCIAIANPGVHTLEFRVADQADSLFDSALLVDAVQVASCDPMIQVTSSAGSSLEVKGGAFVFTAVDNGRVASSRDGATLVFRSNGDYNGDNPNLQPQIWVATRNGSAYDVSRVTALVNADLDDPAISSGGQWLTFASTGDLAAPGNTDGNFEIFRYDRSTGNFLQVTDTAACTNDRPRINDDGSRIAFESDCNLGFSASSNEIVLWDGSFRGLDTTGCVNRDPWISRDASGRYVSFVTQCDGQYPGISNPDLETEILHWDTLTDTYLQVTDTPAGFFNDAVTSSADGRFISFVSTADHEVGQNPAGSSVVFRYDSLGGSFLQLTDADPLAVYPSASIDDAGNVLAVERIDLLSSAFDILIVDAGAPRVLNPVAAGGPSVVNNFPVVAVSAGQPLVAFQSNGDFSGNNLDANTEIWIGGASFDPPTPSIYCSSPNLVIPDRGMVVDTITVFSSGILADLDVFVRIQHSYTGDLRVDVRHLDTGTARRLIDRPGGPPGFGCSGDDIDATLDDEAALPVENECVTPGPIAIFGTFRPHRPLRNFDGEDIFGAWELVVSDRSLQGTGMFLEWCLIPSTQ